MEHNGKNIVFAESNFSQLFTVISKPRKFLSDKLGEVLVNSHLAYSDAKGQYHHFDVRPNPKVLGFLQKNMLAIKGGVNFKIVNHLNGKALVIAYYQHIIGSRHLAYIDSKTIS